MADAEAGLNLNNYKGIYFDDDNEKYTCPKTGAHFRYDEMWRLLEKVRVARGDPKVDFDLFENVARDKLRLDTEDSHLDIPNDEIDH